MVIIRGEVDWEQGEDEFYQRGSADNGKDCIKVLGISACIKALYPEFHAEEMLIRTGSALMHRPVA